MPDENRISELDKLFEEVGTYRKSSDYYELLSFIKKFPNIAPYNAMLVHVQKPGSEFVASANEWWYRYGRKPKPGARPLVILRPFGPVAFVFELNDTEGKTFPEALMEPFKASGNISVSNIEKMRRSMLYEGIASVEQDHGTSRAGSVESIEGTEEFITSKERKYFRLLFGMVINRNLEPAAKMATIFHELGHVFCGHLSKQNVKWLPQRNLLPRNNKEFEAESVCWLLCERLGIINPSAEYLSGYLENNGEIPNISIDAVLKAAGIIESILKGKTVPRKELIIKT